MAETVPGGTSEVRPPRVLTPERAKELRAQLPALLPKIEALLAEFPPDFGRRK